MKKIARPLFIAFALLFVAALTLPFFAGAATLIDDVFADGNSQNQDLPNNSIRIFNGRTANTRTDAVGSVTFAVTNTGSEAFWGFFTNPNQPVTLGVGDRVAVSETFVLTGLVGGGQDIRGGLLDSKGTRNTTNLNGGQNEGTFANDTGYGVQFYPSGAGNPFVIGRRSTAPSGANNPFNSFADFPAITTEAAGATARQTLTNDTPYTLTYTIERLTATRTRISVSVTGGALSNLNYSVVETSTTPETTFDYFTYRIGGSGFASSVKYTRIQVDYSPAAPTITTQPQPANQTVAVGSNVTFSVGASGNALTYQWRKNAVAIAGATQPTLQLTGVQTGDSGAYDVVVSNAGGSVTSNAVALTVSDGPVEPAPIITQQPQDTTATVNSPAVLSVAATGNNLTYQWFKNGALITGATGSTLSFPSAQTSDTANYTVTVSNQSGSVTSNPARLTVVSAISVTSVAPVSGTTNLCADTPLSITFNQAPRVGNTGRLRVYKSDGTLIDMIDFANAVNSKNIGGVNFNYYPIIVTGNTANIYLRSQLAYNSTFYITLEPGVLKDAADAPFVGFSDSNTLRFSTRAAAPTAGTRNLTVAANNTGDFCTVQGAIDFVPAGNTNRTTITVKNGVYTEINLIPSNKPFVTVRGESRDAAIIQYANNNNFNPTSTQTRTMFGVEAADFNLENITLHNTTAQGGSQAEALRLNGGRANVIRVNLKSFQDTLLTTRPAFVTDSYIEGDVDFMWGGGATYFRNSEIKMLRENLGYYTQIRNPPAGYGNVYVNCHLTRAANVTNGSYLSRIDPDDFPGSQVVFIDSNMDSHILPVAWRFDNPTNAVTAANYPNIRFWESNTTDLNGAPVDCTERHPISRNDCNNPLTADEAAFYRTASNVTGFAAQEKLSALILLSSRTVVFDGTPKSLTATTDPAGLNVSITYNGSPTAPINAGTYTVVATINDVNYQGSATATLTITPAAAAITLRNLNHIYDGAPKQAQVSTIPPGTNIDITYNGTNTLPVEPGSYTVAATASSQNYTGSATGILTIFPNRAKAFPEAEGYGAYALGGRNGDVYHVTNLDDAGAGSLRFGIQNAPANGRTIVFDLSGTIYLNSRLNINKPFVTIAGQTAPGDGITVAGETTVVNGTHDVIIRYMRFRAGDLRCPNGFEGDSLWVDNSSDVLIDHVSASWSIDETLSVTSSNRVTVQWSIIAESLRNSCHSAEGGGTEPHGYGSLLRYGNGTYTFHHNLYAHHSNRNPRIGDNLSVDWVNNVIYNWSINPGYTAGAEEGSPHINYTNNYSIAGPNTPAGAARTRSFTGGSISTLVFQSGNFIDGDLDGVRDGANTGWAQFNGAYTRQETRFDFPAVRTQTAQIALDRVLASAGNVINNSGIDRRFVPINRDTVDARILNHVTTDTGSFIDSQTQVGGYPTLVSQPAPTDTDGDGMPDNYENANGLNPNDAGDAGLITASGLSNLERYLNSIASVAPTAAEVTIGGRVLTARGRGIKSAHVEFTDQNGTKHHALTNPFGYYRFVNVQAGGTYVISAASKQYTFSEPSQVVNINGERDDINFVANE